MTVFVDRHDHNFRNVFLAIRIAAAVFSRQARFLAIMVCRRNNPLLAVAPDGNDADDRRSETHAGANQLDHVHGPKGFQPAIQGHIHQAHGAECHANEYGCSRSFHSHQRYHTVAHGATARRKDWQGAV
jgi:hypothetical protein